MSDVSHFNDVGRVISVAGTAYTIEGFCYQKMVTFNNGSSWDDVTPGGPGDATSLEGVALDATTVGSPSDGNVISYDAAAGKYKATAGGAGGGGPTWTALNFSSTTTTIAGNTVYPSAGTFSIASGDSFRIIANIRKPGSAYDAQLFLSVDGTNCYRFADQSDGNVASYAYYSGSMHLIGSASGSHQTDWNDSIHRIEAIFTVGTYNLLFTRVLRVQTGGNLYDNNITLAGGTARVYILCNAFADIGNVWLEKY